MNKLKKVLVFMLCTVIINASTLPWYTVWAIETEESSTETKNSNITTNSNAEFPMSIDQYGKFTMKLEDALKWNPKVTLNEGETWFYIANMPELIEEDIVTFTLFTGENHLLIEDEAGNVLHNQYYDITYENNQIYTTDSNMSYIRIHCDTSIGYIYYFEPEYNKWVRDSYSSRIYSTNKIRITTDYKGNNVIFSANYLTQGANNISINGEGDNEIYINTNSSVTYSVNDGEKLQANGRNDIKYEQGIYNVKIYYNDLIIREFTHVQIDLPEIYLQQNGNYIKWYNNYVDKYPMEYFMYSIDGGKTYNKLNKYNKIRKDSWGANEYNENYCNIYLEEGIYDLVIKWKDYELLYEKNLKIVPNVKLEVTGGTLEIESSLEYKNSPIYYKIDEDNKWTKYAGEIKDIKVGNHKIQLKYDDKIIEEYFEIKPPNIEIATEEEMVKIRGSTLGGYNYSLYRYSIDGINFKNIDDIVISGYSFEGMIKLQPGEYALTIKWNDTIVKEENIVVDKMKLSFDISNKYNIVSITPNMELEEPFYYQIDSEEEWYEYTEKFLLESGNHNIKVKYKEEILKEENKYIQQINYRGDSNRIIIYDYYTEVDLEGNRTESERSGFEEFEFQINGGEWKKFEENGFYRYGSVSEYGNPAMIINLPITGENIIKYKVNNKEFILYQHNLGITTIGGNLIYEAEDKISINAFYNGYKWNKLYIDIYYSIDGSEEKLYEDSIFLTEGSHNIVAKIDGQEIINDDIDVNIITKVQRNNENIVIFTNSANKIEYSIDGKNFYKYSEQVKVNKDINKIYIKIGENNIKQYNINEASDKYNPLIDIELIDSKEYKDKLIKYFYQTEEKTYTFRK